MNNLIRKTKNKELDLIKRKTSFDIISSCYTENEAVLEADRCLSCKKPTCIDGCPVHINIPQFLKYVRERNFKDAYFFLSNFTCMPDICGSICLHEKQCVGNCIRNKIGDGVNIGEIERFVAEYAFKNKLEKIIKKDVNKSIAVIGSGPSSLSFALTMAKFGYSITIFEKESHLGGLLYSGVPSFRLDKKYLDRFVDKLLSYNVKINFNCEIGKTIKLDKIISSYDGVFIGIGSNKQNCLQNVDIDGKNVVFAGDFLRCLSEKPIDKHGKKTYQTCGENVVIVGGGNAAMDSARNALRLEQVKSVKIVYRRTEKEMPACLSELKGAKEEGVEFLELTNPYKFNFKDGKLESVECALMELSELDDSGRRKPVESSKPHITLRADTVILALGSSNCVDFLKGTNIKVDERNAIIVDENNKTSLDKVYAGGDITTGTLTVVEAMKSGINAAKAMDKELNK